MGGGGVGMLVAEEKTMGPSTLLLLLGIELDSEGLQLRLPPEKLEKLRQLVGSWRKRKGCSKRELQSLAGHLNHVYKVVRPGRIEVSQGDFWPDITVWKAGSHDQAECSIQGRFGMVAHIHRFMEWYFHDAEGELADTRS